MRSLVLLALLSAVFSQIPLSEDINNPNDIIHSFNETAIDNSLLEQVKGLNAAKEDPADVVDEVPATDGVLLDNPDDYKTTDYLDPSQDTEAYEPLVDSTEDGDLIHGFVIDNFHDFKTTDYLDDPQDFEDLEPLQSPILFNGEEFLQPLQSSIISSGGEDDESVGSAVNLDEFKTVDVVDEPEDEQTHERVQSPISMAPSNAEPTQGISVDNVDEFRTVDYVDAEDPDIVDNAEEKLEGAPTPGILVPPTTDDPSDELKESNKSESDSTTIETEDVKEKGFLPNN